MSCERWNLSVTMLLTLLNFVAGQDPVPYNCSNDGNNSRNSTYRANLNTLLSSLSSNIDAYGFHNASVGVNPDRAYALALCRADRTLDQCRTCIQDATVRLLQLCPNQWQASIWDAYCTLRYSNEPTYGIQASDPAYILFNSLNFSGVDRFWEIPRRQLLGDLRVQAAGGSSALKAGARTTNMSDSETLYGLVQCTPDLSGEDCDNCLTRAALPIRVYDALGMRMLTPSCNIRYEIYPFYNETRLREIQVLPPTPGNGTRTDNRGGKKGNNTTKIVIIIVVPIVVCLIVASCAVFFMRKRTKRRSQQIPEDGTDTTDGISTLESLQHDFGKIRAATNDFADTNKLGEGGFGAVYVGRLHDGQQMAVKRLSRDSGQGNVEFMNEVLLVAKLQHRNLVRLLGFSREGTERLLIYEFVQNASLDHFLFDPIKSSSLDWDRRYKIIVGIARGLVYLHEDSRLRIIHRDLKPSNVLLDGEMNPKIADFGVARLFGQDETHGSTNRIVGTYGYMSPEYAMHGQFSVKSDVFSFGVLVLEIVSGQKNNFLRNGVDLLTFAWKNWHEGTGQNMIDPVLRAGEGGSVREMLRCVHIGLLCVQENPADRPTMTSVLLMLNSSTISLPMPSKPAFFMDGSFGPGVSVFQEYDSNGSVADANRGLMTKTYTTGGSSVNDVTVTELYPR